MPVIYWNIKVYNLEFGEIGVDIGSVIWYVNSVLIVVVGGYLRGYLMTSRYVLWLRLLDADAKAFSRHYIGWSNLLVAKWQGVMSRQGRS